MNALVMRYPLSLSAAVCVCGAAACARGGATTIDHLSAPLTLSAATAVGTAPTIAVSSAGTEAEAWVSAPNGGTDGRLYVSVAGAPPTELRDSLGPVEAHGEAPPKLAFAPSGELVAIYTVGKVVPGERFPRSALRLVSSRDAGHTWSAPVTVNDRAVFGSHSFDALHVAPNGRIFVAWLGKSDTTDTAATDDMGDMAGMGGAGGAHEVSTTWITSSIDGGRTWTPRVRVDTGEACPCCRSALASTPDGTLYMAWRHVYPGSVRDIVLAHSSDQGRTWSEPVRVHADNWKFDACPHAGPSIAAGSNGVVHVAWWTGKDNAAGVYYTMTTDGGKTFGPAVPLGVAQYSRASHVQLALAPNHRVVVAWDDGTKQVPRVVVRESTDDGAHFGDEEPVSAQGVAASFPMLGVSHDSVAIVWSQTSAMASVAQAASSSHMKMAQGLDPVGQAQVILRRGVVQ